MQYDNSIQVRGSGFRIYSVCTSEDSFFGTELEFPLECLWEKLQEKYSKQVLVLTEIVQNGPLLRFIFKIFSIVFVIILWEGETMIGAFEN